MRVSILTPTMNRPDYVARALRHYAETGFTGALLLGDSSRPKEQAAIHQMIQARAGRLHVEYHYFPPDQYSGTADILYALTARTTTPYIVYAGDDDLLVPRALESSADFLEQHPDFSAAHGKGIGFILDAEGPHGAISQLWPMIGHHAVSDSAAERWRAYMRNAISSQYYVHRREAWLGMYVRMPEAPLRYVGEEVLPCSYSMLLGKVAELDCLAYAFQVNPLRSFGWNTHDLYHLSLQPDWTPTVRVLRSSIIGTLMERDGLSEQQASRIFDEEFWRHLLVMLQAHFDARYPTTNQFSAFKQRFPWLVRWVNALRTLRTPHYRVLSLPALLKPGHPYHADFMPIYAALTQAVPASEA